jgi:hypothetical protein
VVSGLRNRRQQLSKEAETARGIVNQAANDCTLADERVRQSKVALVDAVAARDGALVAFPDGVDAALTAARSALAAANGADLGRHARAIVNVVPPVSGGIFGLDGRPGRPARSERRPAISRSSYSRVGRGTTFPRAPLFPRAAPSTQIPTEGSYGLSILVVHCVVVRKAFNFQVH